MTPDVSRIVIGIMLIAAGAAIAVADAAKHGISPAWVVSGALYLATAAAFTGMFIAARRSNRRAAQQQEANQS